MSASLLDLETVFQGVLEGLIGGSSAFVPTEVEREIYEEAVRREQEDPERGGVHGNLERIPVYRGHGFQDQVAPSFLQVFVSSPDGPLDEKGVLLDVQMDVLVVTHGECDGRDMALHTARLREVEFLVCQELEDLKGILNAALEGGTVRVQSLENAGTVEEQGEAQWGTRVLVRGMVSKSPMVR